MSPATWPLRNPSAVLLLFVALAVAGVAGFRKLSIQDLPDIQLPTVHVGLSQPGAAAAQLETEVARPVEDAIAGVAGLRHLRTRIGNGDVRVAAEFEIGKPLQQALDEVRDAVDRARQELPADLREPDIAADVIGSSPILTYAVVAPGMDEVATSWFVDDVVDKALRAIPGVGRVERIGGVQREVRIEVDPVRLAALGVTATDVSRGLRAGQLEASSAGARLGGGEQSVRTIARARDADGLRTLPLALPDGRQLRLHQVADVYDGHRERTQAALLDGAPVVGFHVYRAPGMDETVVAGEVGRALSALGASRPGLSVTEVAGSVERTREQFSGSMQMLAEGALLAIVVVWWFLRDWRATLVAAMALPMSVLPTFALMAWFGFSLNTLTLLALAVVAGILVDDAIVEIENIEQHRRTGKPLRQATGDAVAEIATAVMATTLTLVVVFLPTALMPGVAGLLFEQFGWTAVIAVLSSLLVARLLTPLLAVHWLADTTQRAEAGGVWTERYLALVRACLARRRATLGFAAAFFAGSLALLGWLPTGFIPAAEHGFIQVGVELAPGAALGDSLRVAERARHALADVPGIARVFTSAGGSSGGDEDGPAGAESRRALLTLRLAPRDARASQPELEQAVRARLQAVPGARFSVGGDGPGAGFSLILASADAHLLKQAAQVMERGLRGIRGLSDIASTASLEQPEVIIRPDLVRAAELGVDTASIAETLRIGLGGGFDADLPRLNLDSRQLLVRVQVPAHVRNDLDAIGQLRVPARGGQVPLAAIATLSLESGPHQVERYDRQRYVTLSAGLAGIALGDAENAVAALSASRALPEGVSRIEAGDSELAAELAGGFLVAVGTGLACMFGVLVLLFKDGLQPLTILSSVPLALGGAVVALLATGAALDVPAMIGLVMLMGIVAKNSILLVDHAVRAMHDRGLARDAALVEACRHRARPIVMTSLAMIAGMLPIALGLGADASFRQPMATVVVGGLVTSTLLSLLVVPVVFTCVDDGRAWLQRAAGTGTS